MFIIDFRLFLFLCSLSDNGWPIWLILRWLHNSFLLQFKAILWMQRGDFGALAPTGPSVSLPSVLSSNPPIFAPFHPPWEVLTSSEKREMKIKILSAFLKLPDSHPNGQRRWRRRKRRTRRRRLWRRKRFCFPFSPLNLHLSYPSLPFPYWNFHITLSLHLSAGKVSFEDEKDLICWQITDWLNIYKMSYYWLLTLRGVKEIDS